MPHRSHISRFSPSIPKTNTMKPLQQNTPMSWQVCYCLDFGFCFNYPKDYWAGYFDTLASYGYNTVMLWVAGAMPVPGFEKTLAWRCDHTPGIVDALHKRGMSVYLMTGVFGWLGMSPGLLNMRPDIEITWPDKLKAQYPRDSSRRGLCPTKSRDLCLDYVAAHYAACPQADGMSLEVFCEKTHCQCAACQAKGLWRIETEFLREAAQRIWRINPNARIIWNLGYERTHGEPPESDLYDAVRAMKDPRLIWWLVRMKQGYKDRQGARHEWMAPAEIASLGANVLTFPGDPDEIAATRAAGCLGAVFVDPQVRNMFLPEYESRHFGYFVDAPPAQPPVWDHPLFHLRAFRRQQQFLGRAPDDNAFAQLVAHRFCEGDESAARDALFLEDLILNKRVCLFRSAGRVWGDLDGGDTLKTAALDPGAASRLRSIATWPARTAWRHGLAASAAALLQLAKGL